MKTAPPRNGNKFTVPTEVPAISTGKSSFVAVMPIVTMADEQTEKRKNQTTRTEDGN